jgi:hypothetical protein
MAELLWQHTSGNKKAEEDANKEAEAKIKEIHEIEKKSGPKVVEQLIAAVITPKPEPPRWSICCGRTYLQPACQRPRVR